MSMNQVTRAHVRDYMIHGAALLESMHIRELGGANKGQVVEALQKLAGGKPGDSWCCAFLDVLYDAACRSVGVPHDFDIGLSVSRIQKIAAAQDRYFEDAARVKRGDLVLLKGGPTGFKHIGLALGSYNPVTSQIRTIEGNTSSSGSGSQDNGDGIYRKVRDPLELPMGYIEM